MKIAFFGDSLTEGLTGVSYFDLLKTKHSEFELFNYGKGGDTVVSLFRRIKKLALPVRFDIVFLWVGVNDVFVKVSWAYPILKRLRRQPWAKNHTVFRSYYQELLQYLSPKTEWLFTVSPLLIGEDLNNDWNRELEELSALIRELSGLYLNCGHIDLRAIFASGLAGKQISSFVPKSFFRIMRDKTRLNTSSQIETEASGRGLNFTLDGVHLNGAGASLAAETFSEAISLRIKEKFPDV